MTARLREPTPHVTEHCKTINQLVDVQWDQEERNTRQSHNTALDSQDIFDLSSIFSSFNILPSLRNFALKNRKIGIPEQQRDGRSSKWSYVVKQDTLMQMEQVWTTCWVPYRSTARAKTRNVLWGLSQEPSIPEILTEGCLSAYLLTLPNGSRNAVEFKEVMQYENSAKFRTQHKKSCVWYDRSIRLIQLTFLFWNLYLIASHS